MTDFLVFLERKLKLCDLGFTYFQQSMPIIQSGIEQSFFKKISISFPS